MYVFFIIWSNLIQKKQQKKEKPNPNPILLQRYTNLYYGTLVYYNEKKT